MTPTPADPRPPVGGADEADSVTLLRSRADYAAEYGPPTLADFLRRVANLIEQERAAALRAAPAGEAFTPREQRWLPVVALAVAVLDDLNGHNNPCWLGDRLMELRDAVAQHITIPDYHAGDRWYREHGKHADRARAAAGEAGHG